MILYHGSNIVVETPQIVPQNRSLDFGKGFYTTENKTQAVSFAEKVHRRRKGGAPVVSIYEFDETVAFSVCNLLRFDYADEKWLDFVCANRNRSYQGENYELIYGPVANDDVYSIVCRWRIVQGRNTKQVKDKKAIQSTGFFK